MSTEIIEKVLPEQAHRILAGRCPQCNKTIWKLDDKGEKVFVRKFSDIFSIREFEISGLCQSCQDFAFNSP